MIKQLIKDLFYVPKRGKLTEKSVGRVMMGSIVGMVLCVMALFSMTYAWYSDNITTTGSTLTAATFSVDAQVFSLEKATAESAVTETALTSADGSYTLERGVYRVLLTAYGTSKYGGYAVITASGEELPYHTTVLTPSKTMELRIYVEDTKTVAFSSLWGKSPLLMEGTDTRSTAAKLLTEQSNNIGDVNEGLMLPLSVVEDNTTGETATTPEVDELQQDTEATDTESTADTETTTDTDTGTDGETTATEPVTDADTTVPESTDTETPATEPTDTETPETETPEAETPVDTETPSTEPADTETPEAETPVTESSDTETTDTQTPETTEPTA